MQSSSLYNSSFYWKGGFCFKFMIPNVADSTQSIPWVSMSSCSALGLSFTLTPSPCTDFREGAALTKPSEEKLLPGKEKSLE